MQTTNFPRFRLAVLPLALLSGFAYAAEAEHQQTLSTVHVRGEGVSATQRINTKRLEETTDNSLKQVLSAEPAISFGGGNGLSQWVTIRGMGQDQIDFKVDDTYSDSQLFHHNGRFMFDPSMVKVIAVQKGTGSASAGIGATSGAIITETVDARDLLRDGRNIGFKVNAGVSSNKGWWRGATVYGAAGGFDGLVMANWNSRSDYKAGKGYHNANGSNVVTNSALDERGLLAKVGYSFNDQNRIELSHRQEYWSGDRNLREEFDFTQVGNDANNNPRHRELTQNTTNLEYQGGGFGFVDKIKANVYRQHSKFDDDDSVKLSINGATRTYGANVGLDSNIGEILTLKYGVNWRNEKSLPLTSIGSDDKKTDTGLYAEGIWHLDPVTLTTGLRYDHFNMDLSGGGSFSHGYLNPSVGAIWDILPNLAVNASLNYATRSPRLYEAALAGGYRGVARDGDLKAERSRNMEIGVKYNWNQALSLNAAYFWQTIKDLNNLSGNRGAGIATYYNAGTLKNHGYELGAAYRWGNLIARAGVAYSKPSLDGTTYDAVVTAVPLGRTWTAGLAYQMENPNLELGWKGRFVQSNSYATTGRGSGGTTSRPGYGVNDFYVNWKPTGKDDLNVNFAVNNAFNKYYKSHSQRESSNGSSLPETGRDVRLSVNYRF